MFWFKLSMCFQMLAFGIGLLIPLYWRQALNFSDTAIGALNAVALILSMVAPLVFGRIGTFLRPEIVIRRCFFSFASVAMLFLVSDAEWVHLCLFAAYTFARWGFFTLVPVGVLHLIGKSAGRDYGHYRRIGSVGFLAGLIGVGALTDVIPIGIIFPLAAFSAVLASLPFYSIIQIPCTAQTSYSYRELLQNPALRLFLAGLVFIATFFSMAFVYLPLRMDQMHASNSLISWTVAMCGVLALVSLGWMGSVVDRFSVPVLLRVVALAACARVLLMALPQTEPGWFILIQFSHVPSWVLLDVLMIKFIKECIPSHMFARAQAFMHIASSLGMALGSACAAVLLTWCDLRQMFLICAALPLIALPLIQKLARCEPFVPTPMEASGYGQP